MKIAITGHTSGLGKYIYDACVKNKHDVVGFSLTSGHDIDNRDVCYDIIDQAKHMDMFINCAYGSVKDQYVKGANGQIELLKQILSAWGEDKSKFILHIGSKYMYRNPQKILPAKIYTLDKRHAHDIIQNSSSEAKVFNFIPGMFESSMSDMWPDVFTKSKMEHIGDTLCFYIENCKRIWPQEVVIDKTDLLHRPLEEVIKLGSTQ